LLFVIAAFAAVYLLFFRSEIPYLLLDLGINADLALNALPHFTAAVAALLFVARFVERKSASTFIGFDGWKRNFGIGLAIGLLLIVLLLAGLAIVGAPRLRWAPAPLVSLVLTVFTLLIAAAYEELLFRGYPMQALAQGIGARWAAALMSALFGLIHASNPNVSAIGIINTVIAGLMLSAAYFKVRSLWLPFGIHAAWNISLGVVLGFSLSGIDLVSLWKSTVDGPPALTGGFYGPEGGILGTLVFGAGLAATQYIARRRN
jgi:membrane protease YdiL (CAAX protease family)